MNLDANKIVTIDFETYYEADYTLRKLPTSSYIQDERFMAHCAAIKVGVAPTKVYWYGDIAPALNAIDWNTHALLAHNTAFDGYILSERYSCRPYLYLDTLSMARAALGIGRSNTLGSIADRLGLGSKNSSALVATKGLVTLPASVAKELGDYCANDNELCFKVFVTLLPKIPPRELELIHLTLSMFCDPVLKINTELANDVLLGEVGGKMKALLKSGVAGTDLMSNDRLAALLTRLGVKPPMKTSPSTGKPAFAFAKTDKGMQALLAHSDPQIAAIADARVKLKSTIGESRAERFIEAGKDDRKLPVLLNYCGAHTTRWSAGNKMNLQNLPRGGDLRRSIIAPNGHVLVVADSAQIEARVTAWLAGQQDLLQAFRDQVPGSPVDAYTNFASELFERPITKKDKPERQLGKICVLALGYGMGHVKLRDSARNGKPPVIMSEQECVTAVDKYRKKYTNIAKLWKSGETMLDRMCTGTKGELGPVKYDEQSITLPNGLQLLYDDLQHDWKDSDNKKYRNRDGWTGIYGGLVIENVVQALARVIVADQMLNISRRYRVVTMSHDEVVCCVPAMQSWACLEYMLQMMKTPPQWGLDIPVDAEGDFDYVYSK